MGHYECHCTRHSDKPLFWTAGQQGMVVTDMTYGKEHRVVAVAGDKGSRLGQSQDAEEGTVLVVLVSFEVRPMSHYTHAHTTTHYHPPPTAHH